MAGGSGKDANYWPGFVDALTNVVIAMVFVIVVLAMALSVSAQLLAKRMAAKVAELESANATLAARSPASAPVATAQPNLAGNDIGERATSRIESKVSGPVVIGVRGNESSASAPGGVLNESRTFLVLEYASNALTLDAAAAEKFTASLDSVKERLAQLSPQGQVQVVARGPDMQLSENQRAAYLRLMTVRNALLDQGIAAARIAARIDTTTPTTKNSVSVVVEALK